MYLLKRLNLETRITFDLQNDLEKISNKEIDYKKTDEIIKIQREYTSEYLKNNV